MPTWPPAFLRLLIDDAAIFPPGSAAMEDAVREHLLMRNDARGDVVGPFVVDVPRLSAAAAIAARENKVIEVSVVVRAPHSVEDALQTAKHHDAISLAGVEVVSTSSGPALRDDVHAIARTAHDPDRRFPVWVELGWERTPQEWSDDLRLLADAGLGLKLRTGGVTADAFPSVDALADAIMAAASVRLPFKCTAGLHSPVRHFDPSIGVAHHGFLNVLIAVARARAGASAEEIRAILTLEDGSMLARATGMLSDEEIRSARELFRSYGSCSIDEPLAELRALGLLTTEGTR